jgi:elongation factor G
MGELHLEVKCNMIMNDYKIPVKVGRPKVAYKMTLKGPKTVEARHIKQSGGSGQFAVARVKFSVDPEVESLKFIDGVKGGSVPREFIKPVEDGIQAAVTGGGRIGFPFCKVVAELYDGQAHDVDSNAMAFETAGVLAFRLASENNSILLEPIMKIEVEAPEDKTGDVIGDLSSRRGIIEEMITKPGGISAVTGKVPLAEMFQYSTRLRSMTQGRGTYSMEPASYEPVPPNIAEKVLTEYAK